MLDRRLARHYANCVPRNTSPLWPLLVACIGIASFSVMDGVMKHVTLAIGAYNAMLWRQISGIGLSAIPYAWDRKGWPDASTFRLHILRGFVSAFMAFAFFYGIARVPLAEGIALSFIAPLITLYLAAILLGERISRGAIIASLLGLAGVAVIMAGRLGGEDYDEQAMIGIGAIFASALLYSYNLILQRRQALLASPFEIAFFQSVFAAATLALASPWLAHWPAFNIWDDIILAAALAVFSLMLLGWAYARAEAQILVSVEYTAFIWAAIVGWYWFAEKVTLTTLGGTVLIVAGCIIAALQKPVPPVEHIESSAL